MSERIRYLTRGAVIIFVTFVVLYAIGAVYDSWNTSADWSMAAYHDRLGRLLVFGGWLTVIAFLLSDVAKRRK